MKGESLLSRLQLDLAHLAAQPGCWPTVRCSPRDALENRPACELRITGQAEPQDRDRDQHFEQREARECEERLHSFLPLADTLGRTPRGSGKSTAPFSILARPVSGLSTTVNAASLRSPAFLSCTTARSVVRPARSRCRRGLRVIRLRRARCAPARPPRRRPAGRPLASLRPRSVTPPASKTAARAQRAAFQHLLRSRRAPGLGRRSGVGPAASILALSAQHQAAGRLFDRQLLLVEVDDQPRRLARGVRAGQPPSARC